MCNHLGMLGMWSFRSGRVLDQPQQKFRLFAEIQVCCKFFQPQTKRETSFSSLRDRLEKSFIISPSNWTICAGLCRLWVVPHFSSGIVGRAKRERAWRQVWLSSSVCDRCCAYQLVCIMTISTYTTGQGLTSSRKSLVNVSFPPLQPSCKCSLS